MEKTKNNNQQVNPDSLLHIIANYPVSLRPIIKKYDTQGNEYIIRGLCDQMPWTKMGLQKEMQEQGFSLYGIALSYDCDNMGETLMHETLHAKYFNVYADNPDRHEGMIEIMTKAYWKIPKYRKACLDRIIYELGKKDL